MTAEVIETQSRELRELGQAVYNLIVPKLEGIPDTHLTDVISGAIKDDLSNSWLYQQRLLKTYLDEFGGNKIRLTNFLTQQYLQPTTIPPQPITVRLSDRHLLNVPRADRVRYLFDQALTADQIQQAVASLDSYWLFRTAKELGYVTSFRKLFKRLGLGTNDNRGEWAEQVLTRLQPPVAVGKAPQYLRKGESTTRFTRFIATEDIKRACYVLGGSRKLIITQPKVKETKPKLAPKPRIKKPEATPITKPTRPIIDKIPAVETTISIDSSPRDFYMTSEQLKIGDFRDHVAQEPGLYLAAWHDEDIRSLLRCKDKAVVDAFWDHYYGSVLLAVRGLIKSYQFPNLAFEVAYREINTVLFDIYQIVKDKEDEETHHNDNGNPQVEILIDDGRNDSLTKRDSKEMVDKATVVMAQAGDRAAFERIVQHYWPPIYNYVYRMMGNPEDTFDFTQDTFMKAYSALPRTSHDLRLGAWLYRIATNNCLDELRHRKLIHWQPWESFISVFHPSQISRDNPERDVLNGENQEEIQAILNRLHPKYRVSLILREYHDFSYDEIAEALNTTRASVKSLLSRAREEFRQVYARIERKPVLSAA